MAQYSSVLRPDDIIVSKHTLDYGCGSSNPVDRILFYNEDSEGKVTANKQDNSAVQNSKEVHEPDTAGTVPGVLHPGLCPRPGKGKSRCSYGIDEGDTAGLRRVLEEARDQHRHRKAGDEREAR